MGTKQTHKTFFRSQFRKQYYDLIECIWFVWRSGCTDGVGLAILSGHHERGSPCGVHTVDLRIVTQQQLETLHVVCEGCRVQGRPAVPQPLPQCFFSIDAKINTALAQHCDARASRLLAYLFLVSVVFTILGPIVSISISAAPSLSWMLDEKKRNGNLPINIKITLPLLKRMERQKGSYTAQWRGLNRLPSVL